MGVGSAVPEMSSTSFRTNFVFFFFNKSPEVRLTAPLLLRLVQVIVVKF